MSAPCPGGALEAAWAAVVAAWEVRAALRLAWAAAVMTAALVPHAADGPLAEAAARARGHARAALDRAEAAVDAAQAAYNAAWAQNAAWKPTEASQAKGAR